MAVGTVVEVGRETRKLKVGDPLDPETQIVTFPLNRGEDIFIFATAHAWNLAGSASGHPAAEAQVEG